MSTKTITNVTNLPSEVAPDDVRVTIYLAGTDGYPAGPAYVTATGATVVGTVTATGASPNVELIANDAITPSGTVWKRVWKGSGIREGSDFAEVLSATADNSTWFSCLTDAPGSIEPTALAAEVASRQAADAALDARLTIVEADDAGDDTAIALVQSNLDSETAARVAGDDANAAAIAAQAVSDSETYATQRQYDRGLRAASPAAIARILGQPSTMANPPTVTQGAANAASTIASAVTIDATTLGAGSAHVGSIATTAIGGPFRFYGARAGYGAAYPDDRLWVSPASALAVANAYGGYFGGFFVDWMFDGSKFEVWTKGVGAKYRMIVDGQYVAAAVTAGPTADGNGYLLAFDFTTRAVRHIELECDASFRFGGLRVGPNDTVWRCGVPLGPKVVVVGDSFTEGTGAASVLDSLAIQAAKKLGYKDVTASGLGGTGYIDNASGATVAGTSSLAKVAASGRVQADVIDRAPDIVIFAMGINDIGDASQSAIQAAVEAVFSTTKTGLPNATLIALGPFSNGTTSNQAANTIACDAAIQAASTAQGVNFISPVQGLWTTGDGKVTATTGSGNADLYVSSDGTHPSPTGHVYMADRIAEALGALLPIAA